MEYSEQKEQGGGIITDEQKRTFVMRDDFENHLNKLLGNSVSVQKSIKGIVESAVKEEEIKNVIVNNTVQSESIKKVVDDTVGIYLKHKLPVLVFGGFGGFAFSFLASLQLIEMVKGWLG